MKGVVAAFNQEKALVGAFSVITNLRMELFEALQVCLQLHRNTRYYRYCRYHSGRIVRKEPVCPVSPGLIFTGPQCQHNTRFITMATLQYFITIHTAACDSGDECAGAGTRILESWLHDDLTDDIMY